MSVNALFKIIVFKSFRKLLAFLLDGSFVEWIVKEITNCPDASIWLCPMLNLPRSIGRTNEISSSNWSVNGSWLKSFVPSGVNLIDPEKGSRIKFIQVNK